jgi:hypothetical protein
MTDPKADLMTDLETADLKTTDIHLIGTKKIPTAALEHIPVSAIEHVVDTLFDSEVELDEQTVRCITDVAEWLNLLPAEVRYPHLASELCETPDDAA